MRECEAIYGGEIFAHHYFRDFAYCDSGMIPWFVAELVSTFGLSLSQLVRDMFSAILVLARSTFELMMWEPQFRELLRLIVWMLFH